MRRKLRRSGPARSAPRDVPRSAPPRRRP